MNLISSSQAFLALHKEIEIRRPSSVVFVDGFSQPTATKREYVTGSVQPLSSREFDSLPQGRVDRGSLKFYTCEKLQTVATGVQCDFLLIGGEEWEVDTLLSWSNNVIPHYKYLLVKRSVSDANASI